jgi:hypothetical protein
MTRRPTAAVSLRLVPAILVFARTLYDYQEFNFVGSYGDHGTASGPARPHAVQVFTAARAW